MTTNEHEETIAMLRGATGGGRETTGADVAGAIRVGKKIRRRRRTLQTVTSGFVLSAGLGVVVMAGSMGGQGTEVVPASPSAPNGDAPAPGGASTPRTKEEAKAAAEKAAAADPDAAKAAALAAAQRKAYTDALLAALGPDFRAETTLTGQRRPGGAAELVPGSPAAAKLPSGYNSQVRLDFFNPDIKASIASMCKPLVEKGSHDSACRSLQLANGRTVQVQDFRTVLGEYSNPGTSWLPGISDGTVVYFQRTPDSFLRLTLMAFDDNATKPSAANTSRQDVADAWLGTYTQTLADVAADPTLAPDAPAQSAPAETDHDRDLAILQHALSGSFSLGDGTVQLEPGSKKAAELPSDAYSATADLTAMSDAAWRASCSRDNGAHPCEGIQLTEDKYGEMRLWASRDAANDVMRGELAIYFKRTDGSWLVATVEVTGNNVTSTQSEDAKVVGQWLESLQDALIKAATDPHVVGTPSTN